jgi:hypothetical protein
MYRQLSQAARDPRYASGETLITVWPPVSNFAGLNSITRVLNCDDNSDGRGDRNVTIPTPVFHVLGMLSDFGDRYWVLPPQQVGGHRIGGFASRDEKSVVRVSLYSHHAEDTQSRSEREFDVSLDLRGLDWKGPVQVEQYRCDRDHNSYFRRAKSLLKGPVAAAKSDPAKLEAALRALKDGTPAEQLASLKSLEDLGPAAAEAFTAVLELAQKAKDESVREAALALIKRAFEASLGGQAYARATVDEISKLAEFRPTSAATHPRQPDGGLRLTARVAGNGVNILVIRPAAP